MTGRHRLREPEPSPINRLVCATLAAGNVTEAELRECLEPTRHGVCHAQIWVYRTQLPAVDAGELRPVCWYCYPCPTPRTE